MEVVQEKLAGWILLPQLGLHQPFLQALKLLAVDHWQELLEMKTTSHDEVEDQPYVVLEL